MEDDGAQSASGQAVSVHDLKSELGRLRRTSWVLVVVVVVVV
jgi:hypothetical protein